MTNGRLDTPDIFFADRKGFKILDSTSPALQGALLGVAGSPSMVRSRPAPCRPVVSLDGVRTGTEETSVSGSFRPPSSMGACKVAVTECH